MSLEKSKSIEAGLQTIVGTEHSEAAANDEKTEPKAKVSLCQKTKMIFMNITVEPIMFLYILPSVMASIATQNLTLEKSCRVNLNFSQEICDAMSIRNSSAYPGYAVDEAKIQAYAATMAIYKNIIQSLVPSLILLFLGSWSDRHKRRKPCILSPIVGEMLACIGFITCTYFFYQLPVEVNTMVEALPPAITGGWFSMFMGVFSFVSNISSEKQRTLRIGAVNMFVNISICIGISLSGILYHEIGFYGVYVLAFSMHLTAFLYGFFGVKDVNKYGENGKLLKDKDKDLIKSEEEANKPKIGFLRDFFDVKHVKETIVVAFKKGENNRRKRVCVIMVLVMIIIGPMHGEMNVAYYFVRYKFQWDAIQYSMFSTFQFIAHIFGTIFSLFFFTKYLKVDDSILGIISSASKILGAIVFTFAPTPFVFYIGALVEILNGTAFIAMRSIVSKLVLPEELGKINSLFGLAEAIVPLVYGPLYSTIYKNTINFLPGAFYLVGGFLTLPALFIFGWLYTERKSDLRKAELKAMDEQHQNLLKKSPGVEQTENKDPEWGGNAIRRTSVQSNK